MFGMVSPYLSMMRRYGLIGDEDNNIPYGSTAMSIGPVGVDPGEHNPITWRDVPVGPPTTDTAPFAVDRHAGKMSGLTAAGLSLLANAGRGDIAGSLAQALAAYQSGKRGSEDEQRTDFERRRQDERESEAASRARAAEQRDVIRDEDAHRMSVRSGDEADARLAAFKEEQERGRQLRAATGKSAAVMIDDINAIAGQHPEDQVLAAMAKRAVGYGLGDESDINKLASLHADATARANRSGEEHHSIDVQIQEARAQAGAGYGPIVESRRAGERLAIEREDVANRHAGRSVTGNGDRVKPSIWYDDVAKEVDKLSAPVLAERERLKGSLDASGKPVEPYTPEQVAEIRKRFEKTAVENVNRRYQSYPGSLRQVSPGEYHYDPAGAVHTSGSAGAGNSPPPPGTYQGRIDVLKSLAFVERELGRPLTAAERQSAGRRLESGALPSEIVSSYSSDRELRFFGSDSAEDRPPMVMTPGALGKMELEVNDRAPAGAQYEDEPGWNPRTMGNHQGRTVFADRLDIPPGYRSGDVEDIRHVNDQRIAEGIGMIEKLTGPLDDSLRREIGIRIVRGDRLADIAADIRRLRGVSLDAGPIRGPVVLAGRR